ncbi:MAG TPA: ABC transporter permease subunit [Thermotogota bacterium]|nr:ABC transporter permease subunit [Thermotogota bacterium]HRW93810.1 ABC transporter permease subunit [Thermotogota bacterium]
MFYKEFAEARFRLLLFWGLFAIFLLVTVALRPFIGDLMGQMESELGNMPAFLKNLLGDISGISRLANDDNWYLLSQWHAKNLGQFIPLFVLVFTFPVFARETDKKTIYFLLARKNRSSVFSGKFWSGLVFVLGTLAFFSLMGPLAMKMGGYAVGFAGTMPFLFQQMVSGFFLYTLFTLFSIVLGDPVKAVIAGIVVVLGTPFFSMIPNLGFLNVYNYITGIHPLGGKGVDIWYSLGLGASGAFLLWLDWKLFARKEF